MPALMQEIGPPQFKDVVADAYTKALAEAHPSVAEDVAARIVRNAGWFKTADGTWSQLTPDLREKVNIRQGIKQPDGRYLIQDVDVFYPNQVKGIDDTFSPENVAAIVKNTNSAVNSGSQPPGLVREHPSADRKAQGVASPAKGYGFNFRASPRPGMTRCDIIASPEIYEEWKRGDWIGLSAGFACDHSGTNMRFGHIALLGADMQALSRLPKVEVFSTGDQLCFSSDTTIFSSKGTDMPLDPKTLSEPQKAAMKKVAEAQKKIGDSWLAFAAGDPEAMKLEEAAKAEYAAAVDDLENAGINFAADGADGADGDDQVDESDDGAGGDEDLDGSPLLDEHNNTVVPDSPGLDAGLGSEPPATTDVGGGGGDGGQFAAEVAALRQENAAQKRVMQALIGRQMKEDFNSFMKEKQTQGHMFDSKTMMDLFMACANNPDAVTKIKRTIEQSPRDPKIGTSTFSANEANENIAQAPVAPLAKDQVNETLDLLRKHVPHLNFSAEDLQLGAIATTK